MNCFKKKRNWKTELEFVHFYFMSEREERWGLCCHVHGAASLDCNAFLHALDMLMACHIINWRVHKAGTILTASGTAVRVLCQGAIFSEISKWYIFP
jgi:hypothetical protein